MSINVYLNLEKLEAHKDFEKIERQEKTGHKWYERHLLGMYVFSEKGRYHIAFHQVEENTPQSIKDLIEEVSLFDNLPLFPKRILGRYVTKNAVAILRNDDQGRNQLQIVGKDMESVRELYYLIRRGKILPEESWEEEQIKPSPAKTFFKRIFKKA